MAVTSSESVSYFVGIRLMASSTAINSQQLLSR